MTIVRTRRSKLGLDPTGGQLAEGEFGYAYTSEKLFVGGVGGSTVTEVGGGSFMSLLTATPGVATADKAAILDSNTEIDSWNVAGLLTADTFKTSAVVLPGFVKNDGSGNFLFGQTGEQTDLFLDNLADVDTTGIATGKHLIFNGTNWVPVANDLIGLADTPPDYSGAGLLFLRVDSGVSFVEFVSISLSDLPSIELDDLANVNVSSPTLGDHLEFDGSDWIAAAVSGVSELNDLSDVTTPSPATGSVLSFDGAGWADSQDIRLASVDNVNGQECIRFFAGSSGNFLGILPSSGTSSVRIFSHNGSGTGDIGLLLSTSGDGDFVFHDTNSTHEIGRLNDAGFLLPSDEAYYIGAKNATGSWKMELNGNDLEFSRHDGASYVVKGSFTP